MTNYKYGWYKEDSVPSSVEIVLRYEHQIVARWCLKKSTFLKKSEKQVKATMIKKYISDLADQLDEANNLLESL